MCHYVSIFIPNWSHTNWVGKFSVLVPGRDLGQATRIVTPTNPNCTWFLPIQTYDKGSIASIDHFPIFFPIFKMLKNPNYTILKSNAIKVHIHCLHA